MGRVGVGVDLSRRGLGPIPEMRAKISKENLIILAIGMADLVTTIYWIKNHGADEANPLFRYYLEMGLPWFAAMKIVLLAGPILMLEWAWRHRPAFTQFGARFAIVAYLIMYGIGVVRINSHLLNANPEPASAGVIARAERPAMPLPGVSGAVTPIGAPDGPWAGAPHMAHMAMLNGR